MSMTLPTDKWTDVPAVSVIIPCYNGLQTLRACVESVRQQDFPITELIVVDDASTDGCAALAAELAAEFGVTVLRQPINRGVSAARNAGAAMARGEILFFVDADGALAPDAIGNAVTILDGDPRCGCVHGMYGPEPLVDDGPVERYRTLHGYLWRRRSFGTVNTAIFALAAIRRDVFQAVGGFDERLRDSEDVEFSVRLRAHPDTRHLSIRLTDTVTARHDEVERLGPMLSEQMRRSRLLPSMMLAERASRPDREPLSAGTKPAGARRLVANRPATVLCGALTVGATVPALLGAFWFAPLAAVPLLLFLLFLASDPALFRAALAHRGLRFLPTFIGLHLLVQAAIVTGALLGTARLLRSAGRRRMRAREATG